MNELINFCISPIQQYKETLYWREWDRIHKAPIEVQWEDLHVGLVLYIVPLLHLHSDTIKIILKDKNKVTYKSLISGESGTFAKTSLLHYACTTL